MPSSSSRASARKKRPSRDLSDSDDSDDDELFADAFSASRSSIRRSARDAEAKKKKRMAQMNALFDDGRIKLQRESRMDEIHRRNSDLLRDNDLEKKQAAADTHSESDGDKPGNEKSDSQEDHQESYYGNLQPVDTKETLCLGSRRTLQLSNVMDISSSLGPGNKKSRCATTACTTAWSSFDEALTDFRTLLLINQQQQITSQFTSLREELLQSRVTKSQNLFRMYLKEQLMCKQENADRVKRIPVDILRWLMSLACGPMARGCSIGNSGNSSSSSKNNQMNRETKMTKQSSTGRTKKVAEKENSSSRTTDSEASLRIWSDAKLGCYRTLSNLWSHGLGFPLQQEENKEVYLLSLSALSDQLCQWFGSTLPLETRRENKGKNENADNRIGNAVSEVRPSSSPSTSPATGLVGKNNQGSIRLVNDRDALSHFLELWALALRQQNYNSMIENNVFLVDFCYDKNDREGFQRDICNTIVAVLWVGLDPAFASSDSAKDDCNRSIQTIIQCLLDRVRWEAEAHDEQSNCSKDGVNVSYEQCLERLSERICTTWSTKLGRGLKGTDAYDDDQAWLSLARTVAMLENMDISFEDENDGQHRTISSLKDFQLCLCESILNRAFSYKHDDRNKNRKETKTETSNTDNWVPSRVKEEMVKLGIPDEARSSQSWKALALACIGLAKLAIFFPEREASKCFATMHICTVCFRLAVVDLQKTIKERCLNETKKEDFEENENVQPSNKSDTADSSESVTDNNILEKHALYDAFERIESLTQMISSRTRVLIMQNICYPWASHMAETMRTYARLQKGEFTPAFLKDTPLKQQAKINAFFNSS
ncbi:unnamed protein product [Pseudo-nitzschia multistriata]|uniref:Uncharacterized protein n=1 Tax=Pseudo-nitzschia multistriata TaxID=183589 RepID=A0A448ZD46_9STRA|nr:unnamed protein product [Pseudo-nitzschia multistriata]